MPALCLDVFSDGFLFAQLRKANEEDIFNTLDRETMERINRGRPEKDHIKIREKYEINTVFIDQPPGLDSKSVVMVKKRYKVQSHEIIKEIAKVPEEIVIKCHQLIEQINKIDKLQRELHYLKKKVQLAQFNNERYSHYEARIDEILEEIGYPTRRRGSRRAYLNYREVPTKGYIKIYRVPDISFFLASLCPV